MQLPGSAYRGGQRSTRWTQDDGGLIGRVSPHQKTPQIEAIEQFTGSDIEQKDSRTIKCQGK
jgi:hypothetical protein